MSYVRNRNSWSAGARRARGLSLIELLVAVTIGGLLIFGATKVYVDSRATYEVNETAARLQETARYALSVIEPDIRMSNYWGLVKGASIVINQAPQTAASRGRTDDLRQQLRPRPAEQSGGQQQRLRARLCGLAP